MSHGRITPNFAMALLGIACAIAFALLLPRLARAQEQAKPQYIVAFVFFNIGQAFQAVEAAPGLEACLDTARKYNEQDPDMKDPRALALGAEWVCLQVRRGGV